MGKFSELLDKFHEDCELLKKLDSDFRTKYNGYVVKEENKKEFIEIRRVIFDISDSHRHLLLASANTFDTVSMPKSFEFEL